jgi:hypothetical protein
MKESTKDNIKFTIIIVTMIIFYCICWCIGNR